MIKSEKSPKFTLKALTICRDWGVRLRRTGGVFRFFDDRGILGWSPLIYPCIYNSYVFHYIPLSHCLLSNFPLYLDWRISDNYLRRKFNCLLSLSFNWMSVTIDELKIRYSFSVCLSPLFCSAIFDNSFDKSRCIVNAWKMAKTILTYYLYD